MRPLKQVRVLVTGATGFIGRHLCRKLVERGAATYGLSRTASEVTVPRSVTPIAADVTQREAVVKALERVHPSHVVHLAAAGVTEPFLPIAQAVDVNVSGTVHVLEASHEVGVQRFAQVGTCYEHTAHLDQANAYAASKLKGWDAWHGFVTTHSMESAALRLFHVYGPEQPAGGLIAAAIRAALYGERFEMTPGEQQRDFVFIDDVVEALLITLTVPLIGIRTYDVGTGVACPVRSVVRHIFEKVGGTGEVAISARPYRSGETMYLVADPCPIAQDLGWRPRTNLETGLAATIEWQRHKLGTP